MAGQYDCFTNLDISHKYIDTENRKPQTYHTKYPDISYRHRSIRYL